jgi:citrate lyase subunit beta / citryl-CoA lyase
MSSVFDSIRSYFYVPAYREDLVAAAFDNDADAVVFDLEHLTPDDRKDAGRALVAQVVATQQPKPVLVRVNSYPTGWYEKDLDAEVRAIARALDERRAAAGIARVIPLQVMIETAVGVTAVDELAVATHLVESIGLGEGDLKADLGTATDEGLAFSRARLVVAARAAGLPGPVQVTFNPAGSHDELKRSTELGRSLGYSSRTLLDPAHVALVNSVYA